ncbi:unnamed protein product [Moneuplotes crassus]|uniref:Uncharacterized protein n=1 Tax=Euplotes crassus TaxID=5936 RepID=A0AAD1XV38_EUPCR|nr:unnamed protein product [Moneuplotes crassus]
MEDIAETETQLSKEECAIINTAVKNVRTELDQTPPWMMTTNKLIISNSCESRMILSNFVHFNKHTFPPESEIEIHLKGKDNKMRKFLEKFKCEKVSKLYILSDFIDGKTRFGLFIHCITQFLPNVLESISLLRLKLTNKSVYCLFSSTHNCKKMIFGLCEFDEAGLKFNEEIQSQTSNITLLSCRAINKDGIQRPESIRIFISSLLEAIENSYLINSIRKITLSKCGLTPNFVHQQQIEHDLTRVTFHVDN